MELVTVLRVLWRYRALVAIGAVLAVIAGSSIAYRLGLPPESRQYSVGMGEATALVDTPSSQVVDLGGETGPDIATLSGRATLLASLMTSSPIKDQIATRAGADPDKLIAIPPPSDVGITDEGAAAAMKNRDAIVLKARVPTLESGEVPIIAVETQAPDAELAAKLADESIAALKDHLRSIAGADRVPDERRVVVSELGPARATTVTRGPRPALGVVAALFLFGAACAAIVGVHALVNGWRRAEVMELFEADDAFDAFDDYDYADAETDGDDALDDAERKEPADEPEALDDIQSEEPADEPAPQHSDAVRF
jgi:hypothetical protein